MFLYIFVGRKFVMPKIRKYDRDDMVNAILESQNDSSLYNKNREKQ